MNDENLEHLVLEMDDKLFEWASVNKLAPESLLAILLARMTLVSQISGCEGEFLAILLAAQDKILQKNDDEKKVVH